MRWGCGHVESGGAHLHREPLAEDEVVALGLLVEVLDRLLVHLPAEDDSTNISVKTQRPDDTAHHCVGTLC
eukprot:2677823-Rhodomonas_salina.2